MGEGPKATRGTPDASATNWHRAGIQDKGAHGIQPASGGGRLRQESPSVVNTSAMAMEA